MKYFQLLFLLLFPATTHAAVTITFVETGSPSANDEYVVIKNIGDTPQDISSWSLQAKNSGSATIQKKNFTNGTVLTPQGEYIVAHKDGRFAAQAHMTYSSIALSGSGGVVALNTSQNYATSFQEPSIASSYNYGTTTSSPPQQSTTKPQANEPKAVSSVPEFIGNISVQEKNWPIQINELYPRPTLGQEEYIEIVNTSSAGVDVSGLWLRDASGAAYALGSRGENSMLGAHETRAWKRSVTRIALNDTDGDVVILADQNSTLVDRVVYDNDAVSGAAYARFKNIWMWTELPTLSQQNYLTRLQTPPVARAVIPKTALLTGELFAVSAEDSSDENDAVIRHHWNFGDTNEFEGATSTHAYTAVGTYIITLTVTDSFGATSSVSRAITVSAPPAQMISIAATQHTTSTPTTQKKIAAKKVSTNQYYTGIVSIPPGLLGKRKFVANGRTVEITSDRKELLRLERGMIIGFTATEIFRTDRMILQISSKDVLRIIALGVAPPYETFVGKVDGTSKTGFDFASSSTDYLVIAGTKYEDGNAIRTGDEVEIHGILLRDDAQKPIIVIPTAKNLKLIKRTTTTTTDSPRNNILMLGVSVGLLILLQFFLTRYGGTIANKVRSVRKVK